MDWSKMLLPTLPLLEIIIRGSIVYLALFLILRVVLKREAGSIGLTDLLVIVLLADASQNAMAGGYHSITDGLLLVAVLVGWSYLLNWLGFQFPFLQGLVKPPKLP